MADWYSFHATIEPIDTASALRVALADPEQRWYGLRRVNALAAAGALRADGWNPNMHPRGKDGQFIEKYGWVRWFNPETLNWRTGWVSDINGTDGTITIRSGGEKFGGVNPKTLYSSPKPKARLDLPDPTDSGKMPDNFTKVGGQGGSNPGALYQIDGSFADDPPDISKQSKMLLTFATLRQVGTYTRGKGDFDTDAVPESVIPTDVDVVMVPRVDGTLDRYDVLQRYGNKWYRVPNKGQVSNAADQMRPELEVTAADAFGQPGSARRHRVMSDLGTVGITRAQVFDMEAVADMVQQTASPLPGAGDKYYVKKMNIPERARSEALANDFYELLGVPVPEVAVGKDGTTLSSKIVENTTSFNPNNPDHVKAAQEGFITDAWLANWDVIGQSYDNIQVDEDGRVWRIDAGGSLEYRAKGTPKGANFGPYVGEIDSLQNSKLNPTAAKVFGGISHDELVQQAKVLQALTPADIQYQADRHNMGHVGPVLIARRKSILDQLGIQDPPASDAKGYDYASATMPSAPTPTVTVTPKVYNPVESVQQVGAPPTVAVHNWNLSYGDLSSELVLDEDWFQPGILNDKVWKRDGDLWVYDSDLATPMNDAHTANWRNLFTGDIKRFSVYDGEDEFLTDYDIDNIDPLIDQALPARDLAIAEVVARTTNVPLNEQSAETVNLPGDPLNMRYSVTGLGNWASLEQAWVNGRLGPTGPEGAADRPLMNASNELWEITAFNPDGIKIRRRDDGSNVEATLDTGSWEATGPWYMAGNDTTAAIWKSKYAPEIEEGSVNLPDGTKLQPGDQVDLHGEVFTVNALEPDPENPGGGLAELDDGSGMPSASKGWYNVDSLAKPSDDALGALGPDGGINVPGGDDGITDAVGMAAEEVWPSPTDAAVKEVVDELMVDSAPTVSKKIVHGVLAGFSPSDPTLSTEMDGTDLDALKAQFLGKNVIILPLDSYENPDWTGDLGTANGFGTVTDIMTKQQWDYSTTPVSQKPIVQMKVSKPYGGFSWVISGEKSKWPKVVIPVETEPPVAAVTFKKNGDIVINGTKVGTHTSDYSGYHGVIDGDHSITGEPLTFSAYKQSQLKNATTSLVNPVPPVPEKPKSAKVLETEQHIKDLQAKIAEYEVAATAIEEELANVPSTGVVPGPGNPLNDGSKPVKGDWVFSTKDGSWAQVLNPNVVGFAGKGVLSPDMIKVKIQDPATGKWKQSNRKRETLVAAAGPGETPFVMQTKAIKDAYGNWIGPGISVDFQGSSALVLDTTPDGNAKVALAGGSHQWVKASSYLTVLSDAHAPTLKQPAAGVHPQADELNQALNAINDEKAKLAATLAATLAPPTPKPKKPVGIPYPGPGGMTVKQPAWLAEERTAKGLKNMKDGYVPAPGMILRHQDGTQYVVYQMGNEYDSHKNSVRVAPVSDPTAYKWRALSTMVVDHEAMLTDIDGEPLPIISEIEGGDWAPVQGMVLSKPYTQSYYSTNAVTGKSEWRDKTFNRYYIVGYDGTIYNITGSKASIHALEPSYNSPNPPTRIGYIDTTHPGGKKLTLSQTAPVKGSSGYVEWAVIHDPGTAAAIPLANQSTTPTPTPAPTAPSVPKNSYVITNTVTGEKKTVSSDEYKNKGGDWELSDILHDGGAAAAQASTPSYTPPPTPTPTAPTSAPGTVPTPPIPTTTIETPTQEDLPVFTGVNPQGQEVTHPPTTSSTAAVPVFKPTPGEPTLDQVNLAGAHSVTTAIDQSLNITASNKANGEKKWVGTYGLADHDTIEDMMVRSQTVKDPDGIEYIEVSFRLDIPAARKAHNTFMTSSKNEMGDWTAINRNATNLVPGDLIAVRTAGGGAATPAGALRPDEKGSMPNATVVAAPVLIGKNKQYGNTAAGTYDVYRTQVMTAAGDIGFIDVEDRNQTDSLIIWEWDATLARATTSAKSLNTNAQDDGWSVKSDQLAWASTGGWLKSDIGPDGAKKMPTTYETGAPYSSGGSLSPFGSGTVIQRDYQGAHIEYATSPKKNSLDGNTVIRVRADDPEAQRKISEAMELVGVSKEDQKPPDSQALMKMATDKVYEQFNPNYTRGKTPNSPQEALDAIDNAVGKELGRKATLDDISIRIAKDGRVQVLVSEDVSRAIVKKNGVKQYVHNFMAKDPLHMIEQIMAGESSSILSSTERFQHGLWFPGMSSGADHGHDSADHMFLHMDKGGSKGSSGSVVIDAVTLHRNVDYYFQPGDRYGERESNQLNWLNGPSGGELMLQRRFEADQMNYIRLSSYDRDKVIKDLHAKGIYTAPNGKPLEEFLLEEKPSVMPPVDFGDEIPLSALPALVAV
jgi:hypothetical protein